MFTNETDCKQFDRDTSFGHMLKRFGTLAGTIGVLATAYSVTNNADMTAAARQMTDQPVISNMAQPNNPEDVVIQGLNIVNALTQALAVTAASPAQTAYAGAQISTPNPVYMSDDGFENSFYDMTFKTVENAQGQDIGIINDILVNPDNGNGQFIIYTKDRPGQTTAHPPYYQFAMQDLQDSSGAVYRLKDRTQLRTTRLFAYDDNIMNRFLSLKNMRGAAVQDHFGKTVGQIHALIYKDQLLQDVYIRLNDALAPAPNNIFRFGFNAADIRRQDGEYVFVMTQQQTENIAEYLYN